MERGNDVCAKGIDDKEVNGILLNKEKGDGPE